MKREIYEVTVTDLIHDGQQVAANGSRVERYTIELPPGCTQTMIMRRAKAVSNLTGLKGVTVSYGDSYMFRPTGSMLGLYVDFVQPETEESND
jgi:hypothetical protein